MKIVFLGLVFVIALQTSAAMAQTDGLFPFQEYEKSVDAARKITVIEEGGFGEKISQFTGSTQFSSTDIAIPGNNGLPVTLGRKFVIDARGEWDKPERNEWFLGGFGDWDIEVPYLEGTFSSAGWTVDNANPDLRCSANKPASFPSSAYTYFTLNELWQGVTLHIPNVSDDKILVPSAGLPSPSDGLTYPWVTEGKIRLRCSPQIKNGFPGEGFIALTPKGEKYYFDWMVERGAATLRKKDPNGSTYTVDRKRVFLLASRVEDRFGNWVNYNYVGDQLTGITSSDGRSIAITYVNGRITQAAANGRIWIYEYVAATDTVDGGLSAVTLPEGEKWVYQKSGKLRSGKAGTLPEGSGPCEVVSEGSGAFTYTVKHPGGAQAQFAVVKRLMYRWAPELINDECAPPQPYYYYSRGISSKIISGPGIATQTTTYDITGGGLSLQEKWNTVTHPDNTKTKYRFGLRYWPDSAQYPANEGLLLQQQELAADGAIVRDKVLDYQNSPGQTAPFSRKVGDSLEAQGSNSGLDRPTRKVDLTQDGETFTNAVGINSFDAFARPLNVTKSSSLGYSRTEATAYSDNLAKWVLGQVKTVTCTAPSSCAGQVMSQTDYDATTALPLKTYAFGKLKQTLIYNTDGTVATVKDGNNNVRTLSSWKRGTPQSIKHPVTPESPSGATESAVIDDNGWIQSVTDETGAKTCYGYDAMGRINLITYPSETQSGVCDTSAWASTSITFDDGYPAAYGMPAGHWRQTTLTGQGRKVTLFDALWRPVVEQSVDLGNTAGTMSEVVKRYDTQGRLVFQSYPMNTNGQANYTDTTLKGTTTSYDALDRPTTVKQDSELGVLTTTTEYLSGFQTRVTNPRGQKSTTSYMAWDQPTTDLPVAIDQPKGVRTTIPRDAYGKPLQVTRSGPDQ
jgi:hypothetical protein